MTAVFRGRKAWQVMREKAQLFHQGALTLAESANPTKWFCAYYLSFLSVEVAIKAALKKREIRYPRSAEGGGHDLLILARQRIERSSLLDEIRAEERINKSFTLVTSMAWQMQYRYEREVGHTGSALAEAVRNYGDLHKWIMQKFVQ